MKKPTVKRKKRLKKIRQAQEALSFAIRAAEREAEGTDLPTAWFHDGLRYLTRLARAAA